MQICGQLAVRRDVTRQWHSTSHGCVHSSDFFRSASSNIVPGVVSQFEWWKAKLRDIYRGSAEG